MRLTFIDESREQTTLMSAKLITVFNQKGGSGKSTLSIQLAGAVVKRGYSCLLIDMDPQGTSSRWASSAPENSPFPASVMSLAPMEGKMHREVRNYIDKFDIIIIDCPPALDSAAPSSAMLISDLALIPVVPTPVDMWAAVAAKRLVTTARVNNETLLARVVPNMVQASTSLAKELMDVMGEDEEFPMTKATLGSRSAFRECQLLGTTVHNVPRARKAIDEVEALTSELLDLIQLNKTKKKGANK